MIPSWEANWFAASKEIPRISRNPKIHYFLAYLLTPWWWFLLEKLTGLQLVKKFPAFHGTQKFITFLLTYLLHGDESFLSS